MRVLVLPMATAVAWAFVSACSSSGGANPGASDASTDTDGSVASDGSASDSGVPTDAAAIDSLAPAHDAAADGSEITDGSSSDAAPSPGCDAGALSPGDRVLTFDNQCPGQTLVVGVNGGYVQDCNAGACPAGMTCLTSRNPPGCFWDLPSPSCGSPVLAPGATATYVLGAPPVGTTKWSGNVYASTLCASDGTGCKTARCATSVMGQTVVQACPDGVGPQGPTTLAEFTLVPGGADYYDVSAINGVNVPVSMGPIGGAADPSNPYTCAVAGAAAPSSGLVGCSWTFAPSIAIGGVATDESTLLRAVVPGGASCNSDSDCSGGTVCGTALTLGGSTATRSCGAQVAWWTADELCAYTGNTLGSPLDCNQAVTGQGTNDDLFGCSGANSGSCYSTNASSTCCGCPDWIVGGQTLAIPPGFACHGTNPAWTSSGEPWAAFAKDACPTAYSFPYDDATSTFTCSTPSPSASNPNGMGYAITFCPGGKTGL